MEIDSPHNTLLRTKFHRPPIPNNHIQRPSLISKLERQSKVPLILVSAPAGYGKSTLVSFWLRESKRSSCWLSLDENDNNLVQFLLYFIGAVQTIFPDVLDDILAMLDTPIIPPLPALATTVINELDQLEDEFIIVLDDVQHIQDKNICEFLKLLLDHPSRSMQLVLIGRRDPTLPIASLRAKNRLTEVRMIDLRFTIDEGKQFLHTSMGQQLDNIIAEALVKKAEGWVTGLHLAVLAMQGQDDPGRKYMELKGTYAYVVDYLVTEILDRQPEGIRKGLLRSCVVNRFCAPLLDVLLEDDESSPVNEINGDALIEWLLSHHLFTTALDMESHWFRYHQLFQILLQRQLKADMNDKEIARLQYHASEWFESQGLITEAIGLLQKVTEPTRAARLVETHRDEEFLADRWYNVNQWLSMLPEEMITQRPKLLLTRAWIANCEHKLERVPALLEQAERLLSGDLEDSSSRGEVAFFHGYYLYFEGQAELSQEYTEEAVARLSGMKSPFLGEAEIVLGLARTMSGQHGLAIRELERKINGADSSEVYLRSRLIASLVFIHLTRADLERARIETQRLEGLAKRADMRLTAAWASYMLACSHLHACELQAALSQFTAAYEQRYVLDTMAVLDGLVGLALTRQLLGFNDDALETVGLLETFVDEQNMPQYRPMVHSCRARIAVLQEDLKTAVEQAQLIDDTPNAANLFIWLESPPTTRARVLIASGSEENLAEAVDLLQTIWDESERCRFACHMIEARTLQVLALDKTGQRREAFEALEEVLSLAGPGGFVRPFLEGGRPMENLLRGFSGTKPTTGFIEHILQMFEDEGRDVEILEPITSQAPEAPPIHTSLTDPPVSSHLQQSLIEPLSHRELDVLELLSKRLQNKEIAEQLNISATTVKTHLRNIYRKLDVATRREATEKAAMLGLPSST
ncbi:MAG: winged helix-turn-helix transcriptional regulator [Desulfofustis sp. PB-SRB1]|jgi:LuxR family maltose regulon positive regulatory protein|nr:winged helix-turn-helix transcriptional regulator [Desulfofustis sp. PB-SRB1]MBM1001882.1 winged helix-turn-helix transcriptional regulator [Desulfofustis sp. PB-SRB1]HBH29852.1 hypothetical protein [Desulfofustis sp.]